MQKRGIGHIEFILSFIIFIAFVTFAIFIFNPLKSTNLSGSSLPYIADNINENASVDLTTFSVKINKNKIPLETVIAVDIFEINFENKLRVESYSGKLLPSRKEGSTIYFDFDNENFVLAKFSKDLDSYSGFTKSAALDGSYYEIASSRTEKIISEKRLLELNETYYENYEEIRKNFNLPGNINFAFKVTFSENDFIIAERRIPEGIDVFSNIKRVEILRKDGTASFADVEVKIW